MLGKEDGKDTYLCVPLEKNFDSLLTWRPREFSSFSGMTLLTFLSSPSHFRLCQEDQKSRREAFLTERLLCCR